MGAFPEEVGSLNDEELMGGRLQQSSRQRSRDKDGVEHCGKGAIKDLKYQRNDFPLFCM